MSIAIESAEVRPVVSVIVTAYNQERFIGEAVQSVLSQDYSNLECIVVDDGSTDGTGGAIERIIDPRLRVFRQQNGGVSAARNRGIDEAKGEIVAFLDGDDRWRSNRLTRDVSVFNAEPSVGITFCNFVRFEEGRIYPRDGFSYYPDLARHTNREIKSAAVGIVDSGCFEMVMEMTELPSFFPTISVRRSVLGNQRFKPRVVDGVGAMLEDWHMFPLLTRSTGLAYCREVLVEVRRHPDCFTWDYMSMAPLKLGSFRAMQHAELSASQRRALQRRIAREYANVGNWYRRQREFGAALAAYMRSGLYGRPLSFAKGTLLTIASAVSPRPT